MSAAEVLVQHELGREGFCCYGCDWALPKHVSMNDGTEHAAHVLDALKAAGYAVVELPEPQPQSDLYDVHFDVLSSDGFMSGPRTPRVCIDNKAGEIYQVCTPTAHIAPPEARSLAAALLAAADVAERV